jgi:hypothetical protein
MAEAVNPRAEEKPRPKTTQVVDLSTACFAVKHELRMWLDVRDPAGVIRRYLLISGAASRPAKLNDCRTAQPEPEMTLQNAASAATRMIGRENVRYINVGFRCAKPLWPLVLPAQAAPKVPAK